MNINEVLKERASRYGEFENVAEHSQLLKELWYDSIKVNDNITPAMQEAMEMILHKLARIFSGSKNYKDSFVDLIGYVELYLKELDRVEENKKQVEDEELMYMVDEIFKEHKEANYKNESKEPSKEDIEKALNELKNKYGFDI